MKKIAILLISGFEEIEAITPIDVLRRVGENITTVAVPPYGNNRQILGAHQIPIQADITLDEAKNQDWDMIIVPGGPGSFNLKENQDVCHLIKKQNDTHKWIAAICAAPIVLASSGILQDRTITAYPDPDVKALLTQAKITDHQVECDDNIITGKGPGAAMEFAFALVEAVGKKQLLPQLKKSMMIA